MDRKAEQMHISNYTKAKFCIIKGTKITVNRHIYVILTVFLILPHFIFDTFNACCTSVRLIINLKRIKLKMYLKIFIVNYYLFRYNTRKVI